ncbi:MAG: HPr family phosphocarrier protein [Rhizobiales bacterium]|nr:HPr family phosphocarrier protein [Hyphomicrobiales bacterium]
MLPAKSCPASEIKPVTSNPSPENSEPSSEPLCRTVTVCNKRGLHARASAKFVRCAESFDAQIFVSKDNQTVGGTSIMGLMMLAAAKGSAIEITADGPEAGAAMAALVKLIEGAFDEE